MSLYGENLVCPNGERFVVRVTVARLVSLYGENLVCPNGECFVVRVTVRAVSVPVR